MSNFEILTPNICNTTGIMSSYTSAFNTSTLWDRKPLNILSLETTAATNFQWAFDTTQTVDRMYLQNINWENFGIWFWTGTTYFNPSLTSAATGTADWAQNSVTSLYLKFASTLTTTRIRILLTSATSGDVRKIGQIYAGQHKFTFANNPSHSQYKAKLSRSKASNQMASGGDLTTVFGDAYNARISMMFQSTTMRDNLKGLYDSATSFVIVPYPTGTSWEGDEAYLVNWVGDFNKQPAKNEYTSDAWNIDMDLKEVAK